MGTRVLLVDDHDGFRLQARLLLEEGGFDVVAEAGTAAAAVQAARRHRPDVVVLDVQLPDGDGFDVAAAIRNVDGPLVVLVSGRERDDYAARLRADGDTPFIGKSELSPETLRRAIGFER